MTRTLTRRTFLAAAAGAPALLWTTARAADAGRLRAGAAVADITPGKDVCLDGTILRLGPAKQVHDHLHARALVLDDGTRRVAFVLCDATVMGPEVHEEAKRLIQERTGLAPAAVVTAATHTHMAVRMIRSIAARHEANAAYHRVVARRIADAVAEAVDRLQPAQAGWGVAKRPDYCNNRRWIMKEGTVGPNPFGEFTDRVVMGGRPTANRVRPAGPIDPDLSVLSVRDAAGLPLALLANYSVHYAGMVGKTVSADYFGFFADAMADRLGAGGDGPPLVAMMSNGTSGNITRAPGGNFEGMQRVARSLADTVTDLCKRLPHRRDVSLATAATRLELRVRRPGDDRIAWARQVQAGTWNKPAHKWRDVYAHNILMLAEYPPTVRLPLAAVRVGDLGIATCPCEVFAETGLAIKAASPLKPTFTISLANGFGGYLPPPEQFELGGYTTWPAESSYLEVGAEPKIREALVGLLRQVAPRDRP